MWGNKTNIKIIIFMLEIKILNELKLLLYVTLLLSKTIVLKKINNLHTGIKFNFKCFNYENI